MRKTKRCCRGSCSAIRGDPGNLKVEHGIRMLRLPSAPPAGYRLKTRLYTLIVFLGLLPLLAAAIGLVAIEYSQRDGAALDRAARGAIHLERVNALVNGVVMDSRAIDTS